MIEDTVLQQRISDELMFETRIDTAHISICVQNGIARLYGHVENYAQKQAAEAAVRRVKGVEHLTLELTVFPIRNQFRRGRSRPSQGASARPPANWP